jgi:hypothetical protein
VGAVTVPPLTHRNECAHDLDKITRVKRLIRLFESRAAAVFDQAEADGSCIVGTAATGALRRTSMELRRALADLRRPGCCPVSLSSSRKAPTS